MYKLVDSEGDNKTNSRKLGAVCILSKHYDLNECLWVNINFAMDGPKPG